MTNEANKSAEAVRGKDDLPVMDPFGIPAWKRPFYFATDVIESYLDVFETTRQRSGAVVKRVAFACLVALIMTTVVIWNLRHITVFTP